MTDRAVRQLARDGTASRLATLSSTERELHRRILRAFIETGRPPDVDALRSRATEPGTDVDDALARLSATDLVHTDPRSVVVAYPFSGRPTRHTVRLGEVTVYAMCAIDALGIPLMTGQDAVVTSSDPLTAQTVRVEAEHRRWTWEPSGTVVLAAGSDLRATSAECCCPIVEFYTDRARAEARLTADGRLRGDVLGQTEAIEVARSCFGQLLDETLPSGDHE